MKKWTSSLFVYSRRAQKSTDTGCKKCTFLALMAVTTLLIGALCSSLTPTQVATSAPLPAGLETWQPVEPLPQALAFHAAVSQDQFLYVSGGRNAQELVNTVYVAAVDGDGALGPWQNSTPLPVARLYQHAMVATAQALYVMGGWDGNASRNEIWRAPLLGNGQIGDWVALATRYPTPIYLHKAVIVNHYLYVIGGVKQRTERTNEVYYAPINADGTLGNWQAGPALPPAALYRAAVVASADNIYVTGGFDGNQALATLYTANRLANGALGDWQTGALPGARYYHEALLVADKLVILGGVDGTTETTTVYAAPLNPDGSAGAWVNEQALPETLQRFTATTAALDDGRVVAFVAGGQSQGGWRQQIYATSVIQATPTATVTPTPTPSPTPSPTPTPGLIVRLHNQPAGDVNNGERITYTISYSNNQVAPLAGVILTNVIPYAGSQPLLVKSIAANGQHIDNYIRWIIGDITPTASGSVSYVVQVPDLFQLPQPVPTAPAMPPLILNQGVTATWLLEGRVQSSTSNATLNNAPVKLFLPLTFR